MTITQNELLKLESCLCGELANFLSFREHAIYFPDRLPEPEIIFLGSEKTLLAPIFWNGAFLGMLRLEGVQQGRIVRLIPVLPQLLNSLLENCLLKRLLNEDPETGLASEDQFFHIMENEASDMSEQLSDPQISVRDAPLYRFCKGLLILNWRDGRKIAKEYDHAFYNHVFSSLAKTLKSVLPDEAIGAVLGKYEGRLDLAILFNAAGHGACQALARKLSKRLEQLEFKDPLTERAYHPVIYSGHALYPQDMKGEELHLPMREQTMRLRDRARLAVRAAIQQSGSGNDKIMGFSRILKMGGVVLADLGKGKYRINLGLSANARVGMSFLLLGRQGNTWRRKGQMAILELGIMDSIATITAMERAGELPEKGDRLVLVSPVSAWQNLERYENLPFSSAIQTDFIICGHAEFMDRFQKAASVANSFLLGISRLVKKDESLEPSFNIHSELLEIKDVLPDILAPFGTNGLIFYMENVDESHASKFLDTLRSHFESKGFQVQTGLFKWPFLDYNRAESEECALKALEYASLLPYPHTGYFNSMAITMSADRKFALGDNFGALEEYRLALLADPHNAMARNSMAVCQAALGKYVEAIKNFEVALSDSQDRSLLAKIHYNLGAVRQKCGETEIARQHYRKCLKNDDRHVYAWLRLGQLSERKGARGHARRFYICAASRCANDDQAFNTVQRHLARLETGGNKKEQARGRLHDNIVRDPSDYASLLLLGRLYLEGNLDPALAEMLVMKSLDIHPEKEAWELLAMALEAQGKIEASERAKARAKNH